MFVAVYQPVQTLVVAIMASVALGEEFYLGGSALSSICHTYSFIYTHMHAYHDQYILYISIITQHVDKPTCKNPQPLDFLTDSEHIYSTVLIYITTNLTCKLFTGRIIGAVLIITGLYLVLWGKNEERKFAMQKSAVQSQAEHGRSTNHIKASLAQPLLSQSTENV